MKKIKVMSIFGTRPEAIKMAPLIKELEKREQIESIVCVTAQHREMLDQVLEVFSIKPDFDLNIMKSSQSLSDITVNVIKGLEEIVKNEKIDLLLVHGDTSTTFSSSLVAFYNQIPVGHVEAGLRTYNKLEPFPEEMNRVLTGHIANLHFAPTNNSKENLIKENIKENIYVTGNTSIDCIKYTVKDNYTFLDKNLNNIDFSKKVITVTAHRRENLGEPLENICKALLKIVNTYDDIEIVYPVHYNPKVRESVYSILDNNEKIHLIDPLNLTDMHNLINNSYLVLTDSGGLQEEVPSFDKPVFVLRNVTERPEGVESGCLKIAGTNSEYIVQLVTEVIENKDLYLKMANSQNPFGDGFASQKIADAILKYFKV